MNKNIKKCCDNCDFSYIKYDEYENEKALMCNDGGIAEEVDPSCVCDNFYNYIVLMDEILKSENKKLVYTKKDLRK